MTNKENLLDVLRTLFRWQKQILIICALAAVGSVIISLFLSNYYKASTQFYAASPDLALPPAVGPEIKEKNYYGSDTDVDRLLAISESGDVVNYLIKEFNLYKHYGIDSTNAKAPFRVKKAFFNLYNVLKTKYDAIEISVEDKDPEFAAAIANAAREKVNLVGQSLIKQSQKKQLESLVASINEKERYLGILSDSLQVFRKRYGVFNTSSQSEVLTQLAAEAESNLVRAQARKDMLSPGSARLRDSIALLNANIAGYEQEVTSLNTKLERFNEGMAIVDVLTQQHGEARVQLALDNEKRKQLEGAFNADFSALHIVEKASVPIVKSRPKRSIIVLSSVFIAFIFSVIGILIIDSYKDVNWREVAHGR